MAKLKVKQIEDLLLTSETAGTERTIQIGANVIKPLTGVSTTEGENSVAGGYISGLSVSGNEIVITRSALPELTIENKTTGTFVLGAAVDPDNDHQINLTKGTFDVSTNEEGETSAHTGSLIFGDDNILKVNDTWVKSFIGDGKLQVKFGNADATDLFTANAATGTTTTLELAAVAKSGKAADVTVAQKLNGETVVLPAGTVQGTLESIAAEIDAMDLTATDVVALNDAKTALQAGKISEADGKVAVEAAATLVEFNQAISTGTTGNKVATMADVKAVADAAELDGQKAIEVNPATGDGATGNIVSLKIKSGDKILDQDETNGLFSTLSIAYNSEDKQIELRGINDEVIGDPIDATDFIKDGMLADAEIITAAEGNTDNLTPGKRYIKFTFKTYKQGQSGQEGEVDLKVEYLDVEDLFDSYTSGNEWISIDQDANTISHKTQDAFTGTTAEGQQKQVKFGANTADATADAAGESVEFKVPSFTVDGAGHVTAASEKTIKVELPAAQTITGETAITEDANSAFISTAVTATKGTNDDNYTLISTSTVTTQAVGTATEDANGLATALDVKNYVADQLAGQSPATITMTQIVRGTNANANEDFVTLAVPAGYTIVEASTVGFLNGQLVPVASLDFDGNKVSYVAYTDGGAVNFEEGDRFDVVATVTKDVQVIGYTAPAQNA